MLFPDSSVFFGIASECGTPQQVETLSEISPIIIDSFIKHLLRSCVGYNQFSTGAMDPSMKQSYDLQRHVQQAISTIRN